MKRMHAIVTGRVQGVGYRYFVQKAANELGLTGWTRNLPDGSVEVEAEGAPEALESFRQLLWNGPALSRVDDVRDSLSDAQGEVQHSSFSIR